MPEDRMTCFVIMPFSATTVEHTEDYWTRQFTDFLKPLIEENDALEAHRSNPLRGDILTAIIENLITSPIVIADLTDRNPNVYWELGIRQSFKHGTITIAEAGTKLPFDVFSKATLFYYPKDHLRHQEFRSQFKQALGDCLNHADTPDSAVLESINGRGSLFELFRKNEAIRRIDALQSELRMHRQMILEVSRDEQLKNMQAPLARFISVFVIPSTELLVTERYLDEDAAFYAFAEDYFRKIYLLNGAIENVMTQTGAGPMKAAFEHTEQLNNQLQARLQQIRERLVQMI